MEKKLVSIIIPVYNTELFLKKCVESVLKQTYNKIEVILINDGSTDSSGFICDEFAVNDNRVKVVHQENQGPSVARNIGIDNSTGTYIQFVDSDDYIELNMTETLIENLEKSITNDIVMCGYRKVFTNENNEKLYYDGKVYQKNNITIKDFLEDFGDYYLSRYINYNVNKIFRSKIIKDNKLKFDKNISWGEDLTFNLDYLDYCERVTIIDEIFYNYVQYNESSITETFYLRKFGDKLIMYNNIQAFLIRNKSFSKKNIKVIKNMFSDEVVSWFADLTSTKSKLSLTEIKEEVSKTVNNKMVRNSIGYFNGGGMQKKIVGRMVKNKNIRMIVMHFKLRMITKKYLKSVYNSIMKINNNIKKTIK